MEVEADTEEEENDAELGDLTGEFSIGLEAGRVRADDDAGQQIADDRRQLEPMRDRTEHQRSGEPAGEREDEIDVVHGGRGWLVSGTPPTEPLRPTGAIPPAVPTRTWTTVSALASPRPVAASRKTNHER